MVVYILMNSDPFDALAATDDWVSAHVSYAEALEAYTILSKQGDAVLVEVGVSEKGDAYYKEVAGA